MKPTKIQDQVVSVEFLPDIRYSVDDRRVHFDVPLVCRCATGTGKVFILEMQNCAESGHYNRWVYYCAREFVHYGDIERQRIIAESDEKERKNLRGHFYRDLTPVKIICIMNFDSPDLQYRLGNREDIVVHWDISERKTRSIVNDLQSWTFVVLPRFLKRLEGYSNPRDFVDKLESWLFFLTRKDGENVTVTEDLLAKSNEIASAFHRISSLSKTEEKAYLTMQEGRIDRDAREAQVWEEGIRHGIRHGKLSLLSELKDSGVIDEEKFAQLSRTTDSINDENQIDADAASTGRAAFGDCVTAQSPTAIGSDEAAHADPVAAATTVEATLGRSQSVADLSPEDGPTIPENSSVLRGQRKRLRSELHK